MKVVIAGSRRLPPGIAPRAILHLLLRLPEDTLVMLRAPASGRIGTFEYDIHNICAILGIAVEWRRPDVERTPGRGAVFSRDIEMIAHADLVLLYMVEEDVEEGYSGTYHMYEKALDEDRPVYGWVVRDNSMHRWGEHDPADQFRSLTSD